MLKAFFIQHVSNAIEIAITNLDTRFCQYWPNSCKATDKSLHDIMPNGWWVDWTTVMIRIYIVQKSAWAKHGECRQFIGQIWLNSNRTFSYQNTTSSNEFIPSLVWSNSSTAVQSSALLACDLIGGLGGKWVYHSMDHIQFMKTKFVSSYCFISILFLLLHLFCNYFVKTTSFTFYFQRI
jgi:hypothetical protein